MRNRYFGRYSTGWKEAAASALASVTLAMLALTGAPTAFAQESTGGLSTAVQRYRADVSWLADDAREGRGMQSAGLTESGEWLIDQFEAIGLEPAGEDGYRDPFVAQVMVPDPAQPDNPHAGERLPVEAFNVVGRIEAGAADRLPGVVVVGAHYDHLGMGGDGSLEPGVRAIHNGADDNASGTAALLAVARDLVARSDELRRDVWFIAFSLEEEGLLGSSTFVREPTGGLDTETVYAMLNMDMVGRLTDGKLQVLGGGSAEEWDEIVAPICDERQLDCRIGGDGFGSSDQSSFFAAGIPVLHFFTGTHSEYHKPSDDVELINAEGGVRVASLVGDVAVATANRSEPLTYVEAKERQSQRMSFKVTLGIVPDYAGPSDGSPGLLLSGVRPEGPAGQAGLERGDVIVGMGEAEIASIEDYMKVLSTTEPGGTMPVAVIRNGERVVFDVSFEE
ncbi:MAG: M28 family peptidase [Gemmatimonadota bacterium]